MSKQHGPNRVLLHPRVLSPLRAWDGGEDDACHCWSPAGWTPCGCTCGIHLGKSSKGWKERGCLWPSMELMKQEKRLHVVCSIWVASNEVMEHLYQTIYFALTYGIFLVFIFESDLLTFIRGGTKSYLTSLNFNVPDVYDLKWKMSISCLSKQDSGWVTTNELSSSH